MSGQEVFPCFRPLLGQFQDSSFEKEKSRLFKERSGHLQRGRLTIAPQFGGSGKDDATVNHTADGGVCVPQNAECSSTVAPSAFHGIVGPGGLPGTAQNHEQIPLPHRGRDGVTAKINREAQMHEAHAKAAEDVAGSSLGGEEDAAGAAQFLNEIWEGGAFEPPQELAVLMKNHGEMFLEIVPFHFHTMNQVN
jgi:hypothetical protein